MQVLCGRFEQKLGALNLGVEVWVEDASLLVEKYTALERDGTVDESEKLKGERMVCLGWKKSAVGKYRLFCKTEYLGDPLRATKMEERPLLESPWQARVEALGQMKDLVSVLEHEAKKYLNEIDGKLQTVTTK